MRRAITEITPLSEDVGLYKSEVYQIQLVWTSAFTKNGRGDILVKGVSEGNRELTVLFAGRRANAAESYFNRWQSKQEKEFQRCKAKNLPLPDPLLDTVPVLIEGVWRRSMHVDVDGWTSKSYRLIATRWRFKDTAGEFATFGLPPLR